MPQIDMKSLAAAIGRASERYVRTHRQGSMATVSAMILFDSLRSDLEGSERQRISALSRPQLRNAMAAHPAWEGKAFEETSFNTVPEDLGDQLDQFVHEDFIDGRKWRLRFFGPTRKFRREKTARELYLEYQYELVEDVPDAPIAQRTAESAAESIVGGSIADVTAGQAGPRQAITITALVVLVAGSLIAALYFRRPQQQPLRPRTGPVAIAVLPFQLINADPQLDFLRVGLPDAIITQLANQHQMRVRPTAAILGYQDARIDLRKAASDLDAEYLVTGTVQGTGGKLRTTVQLLHGNDLSTLWGNHYDGSRGDLLSLQDTIAARVTEALRIQTNPPPGGGTSASAAFELYLQGRAALFVGTKNDFLRAIRFFETAIKADPSYAAAYAGIAVASANLKYLTQGTPEAAIWAARGAKDAATAVKLAPDLAETHEALGEVYSAADFEWEKAIAEDRIAVELNPSLYLAHTTLAASYQHLGLPSLARHEVELAEAANPNAADDAAISLMAVELFAGDFAAAKRQYQRALELGARSEHVWTGPLVLYYNGDVTESLKALASAAAGFRRQRAQAFISAVRASEGKRSEAQQAIRNVLDGEYLDHHIAYYMGAAYGALGDPLTATRYLQQSIDSGFPCYTFFVADPLLAPYRATPAGRDFMTSLRNRWDVVRQRYGEPPR